MLLNLGTAAETVVWLLFVEKNLKERKWASELGRIDRIIELVGLWRSVCHEQIFTLSHFSFTVLILNNTSTHLNTESVVMLI